MSFKTAPRYLSGVSVFLGDDITARSTDGELVFFIGQSTKGPSTAIDLKTIDNLVPIFGNDNPLTKAAYEFWDGFIDSPQQANLRPIALRLGGIPATLVTSPAIGKTFTTTDAYNAIEEDYFVFIDDTASASSNVKIWNANKQLVYDETAGVNTGNFTVTGTLAGSGKIYGVDLTGNPTVTGTTLQDIALEDEVSYGAITYPAFAGTASTITVAGDIQQLPSEGTLVLTSAAGKTYVTYNVPDYTGQTLTIVPVGSAVASGTIAVVGSTLIKGDSELNLTDQELYEKFRNALMDVETFTPDYLVPGGVTFDAKGSYLKSEPLSTSLISALAAGSSDKYAYVAAAAQWPTTGSFTVTASGDQVAYKSKSAQTANGTTVFALELVYPTFKIGSAVSSGASTIAIIASSASGDALTSLLSAGNVKIGADVFKYTKVSISGLIATVTIDASTPMKAQSLNTVVTKVTAGGSKNGVVSTNFTVDTPYDIGIGFVKETDNGDHYTFEWSTEKFVPVLDHLGVIVGHETYNVAHFGYLFANFCQEASVGYNTPLCGMNVSVPADPNSRASVTNWIGNFPIFKVRASGTDAVEAVLLDGTGLLGDAALVGSVAYNRCYMSNPLDSKFADPAYGLLLTDEGFIDGNEVKDTYGKVVDLGKFLCVGAGLLTFANRNKNMPYVDTMGLYALGMLAGTPKNEGISFAKIASRSNVSITSIVSRKLYNDLVSAGYIVPTREKGLGWVINNDNSAVRKDSGYFLISTTRLIKDVIERKRAILVGFIGKPMNRFYLEAAKTKIAESYAQDITSGFLNGFSFSLDQVSAGTAIGKLLLKTSLNPPLELTQVDIDSVIDRNVTNQG